MKYMTVNFASVGRTFQFDLKVLWPVIVQWAIQSDAEAGPDKAHEKAKQVFESEALLTTWLREHCQWPLLAPFMRPIGAMVPDYVAGWANAELSFGDEMTPAMEISGDMLMDLPVMSVMTKMAEAGHTLNILALHGEGDKRNGAVIFLHGSENVVDAYLETLAKFSSFMQEQQKVAQAALVKQADENIKAANDGGLADDDNGKGRPTPTTH